jgi:N4-gp56 family major capsid protein
MATASTTNPADFAQRRTVLLEREMLKSLLFQLRFEQFADKKTVESKGTLAVRFFRARKAARSGSAGTGGAGTGIANLTEGTTNQRNTQVGVGSLDCYLNQRGDDFTITDIAKATDVLDTLRIYMKTTGEDAALDYDSIIQASVLGNATTAGLAKALGLGAAQTTLYNSNASFGIGYFERFAGVVNTGNSANDFATLAGLQPAQGKFTRLENLRCATQLRSNDIKPKDGKNYAAVIAPQVMFDIRQDATLVGAMQYRDNSLLYKWEEFTLDGIAFIETTNPWQEAAGGYGTYNSAGNIYTNLYIGDDAFGTVLINDKTAGSSPAAPKVVVLDKPDKSDPYNQRVVGAWKAYYGSILKLTSDASDVPHVVASRVQSTFK